MTTLALTAGALLATTGTASAEEINWMTCTANMYWADRAGVIQAQLGPTGFIQWNAFDYTDNGGHWVGDVFVGKRRVDHKDQDYNPHGSVSNKDARSGLIFRIVLQHTDTKGNVSVSVPNAGCLIP